MLDLVQYPKVVICMLFVLHLVLRRAWQRRRRPNLPLPPGPKGYPIIGNLFDIPTEYPERAYSRLLDRYGGLMAGFNAVGRILTVSSQVIWSTSNRLARGSWF
jgi:hypothetical protein